MRRSKSKNDRIQKEVEATKVPPQVVSRPIPALGLMIKAVHESAMQPSFAAGAPLQEPSRSCMVTTKNDDNPKKMDTKVTYLSPEKPTKTSRSSLMTPQEYSGKLETKHNLLLSQPSINLWSSEAYSIFEGKKKVKDYVFIVMILFSF